MTKRRPRAPSNYVAEWFGHVVWPPEEIDRDPAAVKDQTEERCPFLSSATASDVACVKVKKVDGEEIRTGFCTASSPSTGEREDWLACPWRVFDEPFTLIRAAIGHLFGLASEEPFDAFPITRLGDKEIRQRVTEAGSGGSSGGRIFAFSSNPPALGGEIDIPETDRSPGNKVDVSIVEVLGEDAEGLVLGRFAIFEIQTADFHGSPLHAVRELRRLGPPNNTGDYHSAIEKYPLALGKRMEGPNKANIFKRTIYQMILKIQMAKDPGCAGFCVVLPEPVWRSWARHLGNPDLADGDEDGVLELRVPDISDEEAVVEIEPAWILVFKVDRDAQESPKPLEIVKRIATDSAALLHYAFDVAPAAAIEEGALETFLTQFKTRAEAHWLVGDG